MKVKNLVDVMENLHLEGLLHQLKQYIPVDFDELYFGHQVCDQLVNEEKEKEGDDEWKNI